MAQLTWKNSLRMRSSKIFHFWIIVYFRKQMWSTKPVENDRHKIHLPQRHLLVKVRANQRPVMPFRHPIKFTGLTVRTNQRPVLSFRRPITAIGLRKRAIQRPVLPFRRPITAIGLRKRAIQRPVLPFRPPITATGQTFVQPPQQHHKVEQIARWGKD